MKKKFMVTFLSTLILTNLAVQPVTVLAQETADTNISFTSLDPTNQETRVSLYQSEDMEDYAYYNLQTWFGFSAAQSTGIYKRKDDTIIINVDERTTQKQMPTYTISPITLSKTTEGDLEATKVALKKGQNIISSKKEGIIHLQNVVSSPKSQTLDVTIQGGIKIPRFILGETTQAEWENQLKYSEIPGYELVGKNTVITGSSATIKLIKDPTTILNKHDLVTELHNKTHGLDNSSSLHRTAIGAVQHMRETKSPEAWMYTYYGHTAYHTDAMIRVLQPDTQDQWGIYHEMGHTYQKETLDWGDLEEVTTNIYSLRAEKAAGVRSRLERDNVYRDAFRYLAQKNKDYNSNTMIYEDFIRLVMFWQLELAFGEEFYPSLHKLYREEQADMEWKSEVKQQYFIKSASKIANTNLTPFFEEWGLNVTSETANELKKLPSLKKKIWQYRDEMTGKVEDIETNEAETVITAPSGLHAANITTNSIDLTWQASTHSQGMKEYQVFRDGKLIGTTTNTRYTDTKLTSDTAYTYYVKAVSKTGETSEASNTINARTQKELPTAEVPTAPSGLQLTGITTNSFYFKWQASSPSEGIKEYQIFREGKLVGTTQKTEYADKNLASDTAYTYHVKAVSNTGGVSEASNTISARTQEESAASDPSGVKEWDANTVYTAGNQVIYNDIVYIAKQWTKGNRPDTTDLWKTNAILEWQNEKTYLGGDKVIYNGKIYTAKQWTKGNRPDQSSNWINN